MDRIALRFVLASIVVNAAIGIFAIVSGDFSDLDGKILATSLSVTGGSVLALANFTARSRGAVFLVPEIGAAASVVGFALLVASVWTDFDHNDLSKAAATGILFGAGAAHGVLLSLSRLVPRYLIVLRAAWALAAVLVIMIVLIIWSDTISDSDGYTRAMGVVIVLLAAATLAVPVLHRASRGELAAMERGDEARSVTHCPNCGGKELAAQGSEHRCSNCGAQFEVNFSE